MRNKLFHASKEQIDTLQHFLQTTDDKYARDRAWALLNLIEGKKRKEVADFFKISLWTVDWWQRRYRHEGIEGLLTKPQKGNKFVLAPTQKEEIKQLLFVSKKTPQELGYEGRFWTTGTIAQFVHDRYGVLYKSAVSYQRLFAFIGFTHHKPVKVNKRRNHQTRKRIIEMVKKNLKTTSEQTALSW